jgi:hypothetical protein
MIRLEGMVNNVCAGKLSRKVWVVYNIFTPQMTTSCRLDAEEEE